MFLVLLGKLIFQVIQDRKIYVSNDIEKGKALFVKLQNS